MLFFALPVWADTTILPANIHALVYKYLSGSVPGTFDSDGLQKDFSIRKILGIQLVKKFSPGVSQAYDELHNVAPQIAESVDFGRVNFDPKIEVSANVVGLAWGLSDRVMLVGALPIMSASVQVRGGYISDGAVLAAAKKLREMKVNDEATRQKIEGFAQALEKFPGITGGNLQDMIVNTYHYKPVGNWSAVGPADAVLYLQAKILEKGNYKLGAKLGSELPTGRIDDPDNLVDFSFGNGYLTNYIEAINDFQLWGERLVLSLLTRFQYNWAAKKTFRLIAEKDFPLTPLKEDVFYKPGNLWAAGMEISFKFFKDFEAMTSYTFKNKWMDHIQGAVTGYDYSILEDQTDYKSQTLEFDLSYSTVNSFLAKEFFLPLKMTLSYSYLLSGINTEDVKILGLTVNAFF